MENKIYKKEATRICEEIIKLSNNNKINKKSFNKVYNEILKDKDTKFKNNVLVYIPSELSRMGYVIITIDPLEIKKY